MEYKGIIVTKAGGIGKITINRPPVNVLDIETLMEINSALEAIKKDTEVKVLIITGAGNRAFCAGVEIRDHIGDRASIMIDTFGRLFKLMLDVDKPTIAVVNGIALGGGCELVVACDMAIASDKAQFGQPEIKLAALPPVAAVFCPRLSGLKKSMEFILSGDSIDAKEAERLGFVNKVVPETELEKASLEFAQRFVEKGGAALLFARRAIYHTLALGPAEALDTAGDISLLALKTEDAHEALTAYVEKRKPAPWKNK